MQLPQELQKFPLATLIVASDSMTAKFYLAGGDAMDEIGALILPKEKSSDNEGSFASSDGSRVAGPVEEDDTERLKHFVKEISSKISELVGKHGIEQIDLVMPAEIEHLLTETLSAEAKPLLKRILQKDLMKESTVELVTRLLAA